MLFGAADTLLFFSNVVPYTLAEAVFPSRSSLTGAQSETM